MGVLMSKQELVALIRRIDLDGDAKISYEEFFEGIKSQFSQVNKIGQGIKAKGILST
jgi:Ca2+-binding EF-hand superfamily protein